AARQSVFRSRSGLGGELADHRFGTRAPKQTGARRVFGGFRNPCANGFVEGNWFAAVRRQQSREKTGARAIQYRGGRILDAKRVDRRLERLDRRDAPRRGTPAHDRAGRNRQRYADRGPRARRSRRRYSEAELELGPVGKPRLLRTNESRRERGRPD